MKLAFKSPKISNSAELMSKGQTDMHVKYLHTGAVELNAQGCAFAHPLFEAQLKKLQILRTYFLGTH